MDSDQLQQWMMDQVSEEIQQSIEAESPVAVPSMSVNIAQIRTFQPPQTERPMVVTGGNRLFPGTISRGEPFAIEIAFSLAGLNLANFTKKPVTYRAQFYARNRLTGAGIHLGDTEPCTLLKGQLYYTAILAETTLEAGAYRLQALVTLQGVPVTLGSFKIPLLQVV